MKVWLDDERPKPSDFDVHVKTPWEAIELLKTGDVTEISLDNDLGLFNYVAPNEGRHVADWIEQSAKEGSLKPLTIHIHTSNPVARDYMKMARYNANKYWATSSS